MSTTNVAAAAVQSINPHKRVKLTGRAFYESIGSPKYVVAPMVDRSEFAWRMLTRSYLDEEQSKSVLAYSPMLHARLFREQAKFRDEHFQPVRSSLTSKEEFAAEKWLDGNPHFDRPLFVQFCANNPEDLLDAAEYVAPHCDAVDLNLGCPQGIAKSGRYGAFLQEDWETIHNLISRLDQALSIPVTAKFRILETKEKTLEYAKMILNAGASILTLHGRRRDQKGHNTGVADWTYIRYLRDNLPPETVLFANGNILNLDDLEPCLQATGADGVMSAEGNLSDPTIFAKPPLDKTSREYWRGQDGQCGYRIDGVFRRYMDIIYKHVLEKDAPQRSPLYVPSDPHTTPSELSSIDDPECDDGGGPPKKKQKKDNSAKGSPNLKYMQGHLFQLLRPMLSIHTDIRDTLARTRVGDLNGFETVLRMVEEKTMQALLDEANGGQPRKAEAKEGMQQLEAWQRTTAKYGRPWWVCQPIIRPLPEEALILGALTQSKKDKAKATVEAETGRTIEDAGPAITHTDEPRQDTVRGDSTELPKPALVCG